MKDFTEPNRKLLDQYKFSLLCNLEDSPEIEARIRKAFAELAHDNILQIQKFSEIHRSSLQQAFEFGKQGMDKENCTFLNFIEEIKKLNDVILTQAVLSCHEKGLSQYNGAFSFDSLVEAIQGNSFKKTTGETEIDSLIEKIIKYRTWDNNAEKQRELKEAVARIRQLDPQKGDEAQKTWELGRQIQKLQNAAYTAGWNNDEETLESLRKEAWSIGAVRAEVGKLIGRFKAGKKKSNSVTAAGPVVKIDIPEYDLSTKHPFFIGNLTEQTHWNIFVDETGQYFDIRAFSPETNESSRGKFVALFVPPETSLPELGKHHATDADTNKNLQVLADLFKKGKNCGVLGVTLEAMAQVEDPDYWYAGFERLFDVILRLLPVSDQTVTLEFFVENRGDINDVKQNAAVLRQISDIALLHLAKSFPEKANLFKFKINCFAKTQTDNKVFNAYNGYVDTVACAWSNGRKEMYDMLRRGGFLHRCLLDGDIQEFPAVMDKLEKNETLSVEQWNALLISPDRQISDSPVNTLLVELGRILRQNVSAWQKYVDAVLSHLDSKAIRLELLDKQISWLTGNMPAESSMPPRLRIIWLTAKLADENHKGAVAEKLASELQKLIPSMFLEDAPLCCWSVLHQAVTQTNAFRFNCARDVILNFCDTFALIDRNITCGQLFPDDKNINPQMVAKVAVVGLRYYGQLLSSLGQHEAFIGNFKQANEYFLCAIKCFFQLSSNGGFDDTLQTMCYWIINLMDYIREPESMMLQVEKYLSSNLSKAAVRLAGGREPADKYRHYVMLRYFQLLKKDHPAVKQYLDMRNDWKSDIGHPWEMIEFYRGMLTDDLNVKLRHLNKAAEIAVAGGPTLHIIAAAIYGCIYYYDRNVKEHFEQLFRDTVSILPDLGAERIEAFSYQLSDPLPPLEFIRKVLPFNFR